MPTAPCSLIGSKACCFTGRAATITIHGEGVAVFAEGDPLSHGRAAQVDLVGATIAPHEGVSVTLVKPALLEPLPMSASDQAYEVTYTAGSADKPVTIELHLPKPPGSSASSTNFKGALEGAPGCAEAACPVVWNGDVKTVSLRRADETAMDLTDAFPGRGGQLSKVQLMGAHGTLRCKEDGGIHEEAIDAAPLQWLTVHDGVLIVQPIRLEGHALGISIQNSIRPRSTTREAPSIPISIPESGLAIGPSPLALLGLGAGFGALVVVVVVLARRRSSGMTVNITGSAIGAVAVGEGATSTGHVHGSKGEPTRADPNTPAAQSPLFDRLSALLPAQFETLVYKLQVPPAYLSGPSAPQAIRAVEILRWAEHAHKLPDVERFLAEVARRA